MKGLVKQVRYVEVELLPGDKVELDGIEKSYFGRPYRIVRLVENGNHVYAVFNNDTWRPLSTYGITWRKVE
jgi:hypothetical protein